MNNIEELISNIRAEASKLCGIADCFSYAYCDDELAEAIDKIEFNIHKNCDCLLSQLKEEE